MASINKSSERWSDEEVSALLEIYAEDATQGMLLKPVPNSKMFERCSKKLLELGIVHSATVRRLKIKKLRQDYKQIKDYYNKSGNDRKTSKWYERLDALLGHRPFSGTASTFDLGTMVWEAAAQTADSVANDHDHDEGKINAFASTH
ncbi:hypothetical protein OYC64_019000 [Pagothenia borchgrevinki]|uniref:Myb/SANT-like DNA-binding domain-containing protein n=1 Tax=Pagothenia borchgrevinki TaxID=8213 RepID=A0ABD2GRR9_PAGBO